MAAPALCNGEYFQIVYPSQLVLNQQERLQQILGNNTHTNSHY